MKRKATLIFRKMRKQKYIGLFFLVFMFGCQIANAQILKSVNPTKKSRILPKLYSGIKIGSNFSYLSGKNWENGIKSNILGGVFAGVQGAGFGAQIEGVFEQSDYTTGPNFYSLYKSYYNDIKDSLSKGNFRVNKLSLPLILQFRVSKIIWLQGGMQFYGIVNVKDNNSLVNNAKTIFKNGNSSGILGAAVHLGNANIGARMIVDFQSLNNLNSGDIWRQYLFQIHLGVKVF